MTHNYERYLIKQSFKLEHGVEITEAQLDRIEEIYFENKKGSISNLIFYRLINAVIGLIGVFFFLMVRNIQADKWFFVGFVALFMIYNAIHCFNTLIDFKRLKRPKKIADGRS